MEGNLGIGTLLDSLVPKCKNEQKYWNKSRDECSPRKDNWNLKMRSDLPTWPKIRVNIEQYIYSSYFNTEVECFCEVVISMFPIFVRTNSRGSIYRSIGIRMERIPGALHTCTSFLRSLQLHVQKITLSPPSLQLVTTDKAVVNTVIFVLR